MSNTNTPLHLAVQNGNVEIVKILLSSGSDTNARNADGLTPLDLAAMTNNTEIVALLVAQQTPTRNIKPGQAVPPPVPSAPPATASPTTSLIIERKSGFPDFFREYAVFVDGVEIGSIKPGRYEFPIAPGQHSLVLKTKGSGKYANPTVQDKWVLGSEEIDFTVAEKEHVSFFVKNAFSFLNWKLLIFNMYYYLLYDPSGWIIVEKR